MFYVKMDDTITTGWGLVDNKSTVFVMECETHEQALIVVGNAEHRGDVKNVVILDKKPEIDRNEHIVLFDDKLSASNWYELDFFKK